MLAKKESQDRIRAWEREERARLLAIAENEVVDPVLLGVGRSSETAMVKPEEDDGWEEKEKVDEALERGAKMLAGLQEAQWEALRARRNLNAQITKTTTENGAAAEYEPSPTERAIGQYIISTQIGIEFSTSRFFLT
jgi:hypothetical protein